MLKIPKSFKMGPHTYRIKIEESLQAKENLLGQHISSQKLIRLQKKIKSLNRPDSDYYHTFMHEVVHAILDTMQEDDLCHNEKFVDLFSAFLTQMLTTMEY